VVHLRLKNLKRTLLPSVVTTKPAISGQQNRPLIFTPGLSPEDAWIASRFVIEISRPLLFQILAILLILNAVAFSL
jgi:hypothetical protein